MRIERLRATYDLRLQWVHFPLHPDTPPEGVRLEDLFAGRSFDLEGMMARILAVADEEGLPMGRRSMTYNSRLAQELAAWAVTLDGGDKIHDALFRAYFVDGLNVHDVDVLASIAEGIGLSPADARAIVEERRFEGAVGRDWLRSQRAGVTGVPTFVAGGRGAVGAQPYEVLEDLVVKAGAVIGEATK